MGTESDDIEALREFNRYFTKQLGLLEKHFLASPFSLAEARVLFEIARAGLQSASEIRVALDIDAGYLSRILDSFKRDGLLSSARSAEDGRSRRLRLTARGQTAFAQLDLAQSQAIAEMLSGLSQRKRGELVRHMEGIRRILGQTDGAPGGRHDE